MSRARVDILAPTSLFRTKPEGVSLRSIDPHPHAAQQLPVPEACPHRHPSALRTTSVFIFINPVVKDSVSLVMGQVKDTLCMLTVYPVYINQSSCLFSCLSQMCVSHLSFVVYFVHHFFIQKILISVSYILFHCLCIYIVLNSQPRIIKVLLYFLLVLL